MLLLCENSGEVLLISLHDELNTRISRKDFKEITADYTRTIVLTYYIYLWVGLRNRTPLYRMGVRFSEHTVKDFGPTRWPQ